MTKHADIDWEQIQAEYRTGQLSIRGLASKHGISDGAIRKRIKKEGWNQDNKKAVRVRTKKKVRTSPSRKAEKVRSTQKCVPPEQKEPEVKNPPTTRELIEAELVRAEKAVDDAVNTNMEVIATHRLDCKRVRTLMQMMMAELAFNTVNQEELEAIALEQSKRTDEEGKEVTDYQKLNRFMRALSLKDRTGTLRDLAMVLERVIAKERQAFGILDEEETDDGSPDVILIGDYRPDGEEDDS